MSDRTTRILEPVLWSGPDLPPGIEDLLAEAKAAGYDWIAPFAEQWAERPFTGEGEGLFVVLHDGRAGAIAAISADQHLLDGETGRLKFIYVREGLRGRGIAERFVRCCLERAGTRWRRIRLHTDNPVAARLYARYGFEPVDEVRATHALLVRSSDTSACGDTTVC